MISSATAVPRMVDNVVSRIISAEEEARHQQQQLDALVLIATQSFTGETFVQDILLDKFYKAGLYNVETRLVDEVFTSIDNDVDKDQTAHLNNNVQSFWPRTLEVLLSNNSVCDDSIGREESTTNKTCNRSTESGNAQLPPVLLVTSTFGDGEPPNHAMEFAAWLASNKTTLSSIPHASSTQSTTSTTVQCDHDHDHPLYAVFGLGDRTYAKFAAFGEYADKRLHEKGGRRMLPFSTGDRSTGKQQEEFEEWCTKLIEIILSTKLPSLQGTGRTSVSSRRNPFPNGTGTEWQRSIIEPESCAIARIVESRELLRQRNATNETNTDPGTSTRSVVHVTLSLPESNVPSHIQPGDHVCVYPENDPLLVQAALEWLNLECKNNTQTMVATTTATTTILEQSIVQNTGTKSSGHGERSEWVRREITAFEFLSKHVDLSGRATQSILRSLIPFCGTLELRALARELTVTTTTTGTRKNSIQDPTTSTSSSAFDEWVGGRFLTAFDLIRMFECRPSLQALARVVGPIYPRMYSIMSVDRSLMDGSTIGHHEQQSNDDCPTPISMIRIGMCIAVVPGGLCSNYLARLEAKSGVMAPVNSPITVFFQPSQFHFSHSLCCNGMDNITQDYCPQKSKPAILVAAGSGVGTCLGFIEEELRLQRQAFSTSTRRIDKDAFGSKTMGIDEDKNHNYCPPLLSHLTLFFGCQSESELLYRDRLYELSQDPLIGLNVHISYSREPCCRVKRYVQDMIREAENTFNVWNGLSNKKGCVYVCGRLELVDGVKHALAEVARISGGLDHKTSEKFVSGLVCAGRIKTDCWSVAANPTDTSTPANAAGLRNHRQHVVLRLERHHINEDQHAASKDSKFDVSAVPEWPSYLRLLASGELQRRVKRAEDMWSACVACGRNCETDRLSHNPKDWGECRVGRQAIVASAFPHFGEEDCLRGTLGSGTIFFGACNLQCMYCQNWDISAKDEGNLVSDKELAQIMLNLQSKGCHNINFVSPTHNVLPILSAVLIAAKNGLRRPLVWNTGGYDSVASLRLLDGVIDIYMPDCKYANREVARRLSKIDNYPEINHAAVKEMQRQVGSLQIDRATGLAIRGVLVRHLILPRQLAGTCDVMSFLAKEVSKETFTNVMDQYRPEHHAIRDKKFGLSKPPTTKERRDAHRDATASDLYRFDDQPSLDW